MNIRMLVPILSLIFTACGHRKPTSHELLVKKPKTPLTLDSERALEEHAHRLVETADTDRCKTITALLGDLHEKHFVGVELSKNVCERTAENSYTTKFTFSREGSRLGKKGEESQLLQLTFQLKIEKLPTKKLADNSGAMQDAFSVEFHKLKENKPAKWKPQEERYLLHVNIFHLEKTLRSIFETGKTTRTAKFCLQTLGRDFDKPSNQCVFRKGNDVGISEENLSGFKDFNTPLEYFLKKFEEKSG